ncbi:MAG: 16S rRNA (uracil(1498)-N(3))-methyltransferase [Propionibacteriaceae bacterium]|nr:16S rRNA (uracil(1498)-N(3))-methyltransferase [Propionibacteriaceae bacterium]
MTDALFLAGSVDVPVGGVLHLDGPEGRHAAAVRRLRAGEPVLVADGRGSAIQGVTKVVGRDFVDVEVAGHLREPARQHRWVGVQALAKGSRDEQAIEAMTELGVDEVLAWPASRSIVEWRDYDKQAKGLAKWASTLREAAKQSRRFSVPGVGFAATGDVCARIGRAAQAFVLHESAPAHLDAQPLVASGEVVFIVGPEGGISPEELAQFEDAGATPVLVADHVLRTSTAGVVALAQLQAMARAKPGPPERRDD